MLIEFSVTNFRSFREKQTFSMVAAPRLRKRENVFKPAVKGEKLPDLLKVAAIYGPNASGKSNLIKALDVVREVASRQPSANPTPLPVAPFRFDSELIGEPSRVEMHFICMEQRYQFDLALTSERVMEERLWAFIDGKESLLYERRYLNFAEEYTFGKQLQGEKELHNLWRKATGPQMLFIVQAVANSSEEFSQLRRPLQWLRQPNLVDCRNMEALITTSQNLANLAPGYADDLSIFLNEVDVPVTNIRFEQSELSELESVFGIGPGGRSKRKMVLTHETALGTAEFDFHDESDGTKNLVGFWLPWHLNMPPNLNQLGVPLVVDEFDSSLHPELVASLVAKCIHAESPIQLIFTTHDTHLMDTKILRRDQFWLTERDANGATQLRSIHDFEGREGEDLEKRYYEGRYRALPIIRRS
ncbi:ATP-binding protein [Methylomonas sp. OY6]|uniref:ATP-binding protein n=1 Tax=Methylomonas defluvii TaxID=3045149 RepID=A0ABU4U9A7_9GAMM|nr:ATP-binding protein [Methylomonas sp. OY6]MDX8126003.1 ATP-binding protein [Methylomonas sp. OY6]